MLSRETGNNLYLMQDISFQFLIEGGKSSPAPPVLAEVCPGGTASPRELSAMIEPLDRIQPNLNLRRGTS